jgi:zinc/manganese transport system substrate-binding protein
MRFRSVLPLLAATLLSGGEARANDLHLVAATTDVGAIARAVVGEAARIDVVARPDRDPHSLQVRPGIMAKAAKADFYLEAGLSLDRWSDQIVRGSRNRNLRVIDCSQWIEPLEVPVGKVDPSRGDVHPEGNPHWWLDPVRAAQVARGLAEELGRARPERAVEMRANAERFAAEIEQRLPAWQERAHGAEFLEYHRSWVYFADRLGAVIVDEVEPLPGIPPSARHLAELVQLVRERGVATILRDPYHDPSPVEFLSREAGVREVVLGSACPEADPGVYLAHLEAAVEAIAP